MMVPYGTTVFDESISRIEALYRAGHRVVVSFSGGKDSGIILELARIAAERAGKPPVEVVMRDEERSMAMKDMKVYRVNLMFVQEEAELVQEVLGNDPAQPLLKLCRLVKEKGLQSPIS